MTPDATPNEDLMMTARETDFDQAKDALLHSGREMLHALTTVARDGANLVGNRAKDVVAQRAAAIADHLQDMAEGEHRDTLPGHLMGSMADGVADVSARLQNQSLDDIASRAGSFARQNPALFLAGAAMAGFAAARFLRASAPDGSDRPAVFTDEH
jgi:hypothetical protein